MAAGEFRKEQSPARAGPRDPRGPQWGSEQGGEVIPLESEGTAQRATTHLLPPLSPGSTQEPASPGLVPRAFKTLKRLGGKVGGMPAKRARPHHTGRPVPTQEQRQPPLSLSTAVNSSPLALQSELLCGDRLEMSILRGVCADYCLNAQCTPGALPRPRVHHPPGGCKPGSKNTHTQERGHCDLGQA